MKRIVPILVIIIFTSATISGYGGQELFGQTPHAQGQKQSSQLRPIAARLQPADSKPFPPADSSATPGKPAPAAEIEAILKEDMFTFIGMVREGADSKLLRSTREAVLEKARSLNAPLADYLERVLPETSLALDENDYNSILTAVLALNRELLTIDSIGLYLDAEAKKGEIVFRLYRIVDRKKYEADNGLPIEVFYIEQISPGGKRLTQGFAIPGEGFVCVQRDLLREKSEEILRVLRDRKGLYYTRENRQFLSKLEGIAKTALSMQFAQIYNTEQIQRLIEFHIELHELKHKELEQDKLKERLAVEEIDESIEEVLADLASLALGPAPYYYLLNITEGFATRDVRYRPSQRILDILARCLLRYDIKCETTEDAVMICAALLETHSQGRLRHAAHEIYQALADQYSDSEYRIRPIDAGVVGLAVEQFYQKAYLARPSRDFRRLLNIEKSTDSAA